jgi:predicted deacylase
MKHGWQSAGAIEWFAVEGEQSGPRVVVVGGIHGDEYEGPAAVAALVRLLRPEDVAGTIVAVPVANPMAFAASQRTTPSDGMNLARTFPGNPAGSDTERLAAFLWNEIVGDARYIIDLHSGGVEYGFIPVAGFYGDAVAGNASYESALRFGLPHLWQLPPTNGVLSNEAWKRGVTAIGMEYLGAGQLSREGADAYLRGILSCLAYWGVLRGREALRASGEVIYGDWMLASAEGIFRECVALGTAVEAGQRVAEIVNTRGEPLQEFVAAAEGIVAGLRSKAYIREGNWGVLIGTKEPAC